jgi:hypothetical protein
MNEIIKGNPQLMRDPLLRDWHNRLKAGGNTMFEAGMEVVATFSQGKLPEAAKDREFYATIWESYLKTAEKYNDPGRFTSVIGYEWTSTPGGLNLHRNILFRGGMDDAKQMLPFTGAESLNPEDLWEWMGAFEEKTGSRVLALAHNGNLSNGLMFPMVNPETGKPLTKEYAEARIRWEPIYEVTQIKGDGETHPYLSPNDEWLVPQTAIPVWLQPKKRISLASTPFWSRNLNAGNTKSFLLAKIGSWVGSRYLQDTRLCGQLRIHARLSLTP